MPPPNSTRYMKRHHSSAGGDLGNVGPVEKDTMAQDVRDSKMRRLSENRPPQDSDLLEETWPTHTLTAKAILRLNSISQLSARMGPKRVEEMLSTRTQTWKGSCLSRLFQTHGGRSSPPLLASTGIGKRIAKLLDCTTWTGAGPGLMDAAFKGALESKKPVGGFKIERESGEWTSSNSHPYLPAETYLTCRFFSARKHALVDAAVRNDPTDMTAVVAFPGGIGTLDEVFEILALIQLERIGSRLPIPFLLMNYDSYYSKLLDFIEECELWGTVARGEVGSLWKVCSGNSEALEYLSEFYSLPQSRRIYDIGVGDIGVGKEQGMVS